MVQERSVLNRPSIQFAVNDFTIFEIFPVSKELELAVGIRNSTQHGLNVLEALGSLM